MAFDYRRLLIPLKKPEIDTSLCYGCYGGCPDYCSNIYSSALQPPPPPPPAASQSHRFSTILAVMLGVLGLALVFLSYLTIRGYRIRSRRNNTSNNNSQPSDRFRDDENQGPVLDHPIWYIRTVGFPQSVIDTIAVFKYAKGEGIVDGTDCSICLNEFREDESLRLLPKCSHAFHLPCVDTWLRAHKNCPVCRAPVLSTTTDSSSREVVADVSTGTRNWDGGVMTRDRDPQAGESGGRGNGVEEARDRVREVTSVSDHVVLPRIEDEVPLKSRVLIDQPVNHEPLRRSFSMDFLSAISSVHHHHHPMNISFGCKKQDDEGCSSELSVIVEKQQDLDILDGKGLDCKSSSLSKSSSSSSSQKGPVLMLKRSFSFSGRSLWKAHSKSVESISIPEA